MPVFEYQCKECSTKFEILHKSSVNQEEIICPKCNSRNAKKLFSTFSASMETSGSSCESGNCGLANNYPSCANGMCGLN
ncbi:MAG: zinc ribbon domain-containing protein [Ignavibacteriales bacterium]|nr:zinc ribbon domain-containing protein [Ignavibacteriales bacterium]